MNETDLTQAKAALTTDREGLVHQLNELGATETGELRAGLNQGDGFSDAPAITAERTERLGVIRALKKKLDSVDRALSRIDDGQYGSCVRCGEPIPAARLEFRPASVYCVACKSSRG
ncbi:MAG: TraR/DksA C4-type zinc finger protein [bacterium]|nr:TraR/DksA C4-type zinc finger protein [Acidimicrobiia bacterium]MCY4650557.1 TraR/DksA C4-type zinc finger protein [bacterium]